jgi:Tol biopolymer transport system component
MLYLKLLLLASPMLLTLASGAAKANGDDAGTFLVTDRGYALLGPDGDEKDRLGAIVTAAGALSPDGQWVAFSNTEPNPSPGHGRGTLVIQSRAHAEKRMTVPLIWGSTGSSFLPIWSYDSSRIIICEQGWNADGSHGSAYRVYNLSTKSLSDLKMPSECWVSDWSADGKRLLTDVRRDGDPVRVAWVNVDSSGSLDFVTGKDEVAARARLSPNGERILCMAGPKPLGGERSRTRLTVIDLATKKQTVVDEPGETNGYCWSPDGSRIAYTWQRSLDKPSEVSVRETVLITCNVDGTNRKTVTRRKYEVPKTSSGRSGVVFFFNVLDWR